MSLTVRKGVGIATEGSEDTEEGKLDEGLPGAGDLRRNSGHPGHPQRVGPGVSSLAGWEGEGVGFPLFRRDDAPYANGIFQFRRAVPFQRQRKKRVLTPEPEFDL